MEESNAIPLPQTAKRMLRGHQPARAVLLDLSHTVEIKVWHRVLSALHGLVSLVCNLAGPPRIPLISFYILDAYPEILLPFSPPKGNLCRIITAMRDIRTYIEDRVLAGAARSTSCVEVGVVEACGQYRRHLNAMGQLQGGGSSLQMDQLEVVVLSGARDSDARALVDSRDSRLDMTYLKRLVLVLMEVNNEEDLESPHSSNSNPKDTEDNGIVDIVHVETDASSLQKFFYSWLLDNSGDSEHLHLVLPPASPVDRDLLIKCDIVERIINPAQLPHHELINLHSDSTHCKMVFPCPSKAAGLTVPVYNLKVISILPADSVCDSLVFGLPLLVQATTCWRIDWEELEVNTASFHALCNELREKNQALLVQLHQQKASTNNTTTTTSTRTREPASSCIQGMFVMLPSPNNSLLLKALATRELVLPTTWTLTTEDTGGDHVLRVQSSLSQVPEMESYNPLRHCSGLVDVLLAQAAPKQQAVRPRPAAKRKVQPAKETEVQDRTWSEMSVPMSSSSSRLRCMTGRGRGRGVGCTTLTPPATTTRPSTPRHTATSIAVGRNRVTTRLPDGFLVDLE